MEKLLDYGKISIIVENFHWKFLWLPENSDDCGKVIWLWKISMTVEKFFDQGKFPWLWTSSLIKENFLDSRKFTFLTAEKIIGLIILKANASVETIKTYLLSLEQKLSSIAFFFLEDKINIIFSWRLKHKY